MIQLRVAGPDPRRVARRRAAYVVVGLVVLLVASTLMVHLAGRARAADASRCERFAASSSARAALGRGSGPDVLVIGDSYSVGLGLAAPVESWPARLPGRVHVAGFSGSGFSRDASPCANVSFSDRAPAALGDGVDLVVVQGGLNDVDQSSAAISAGFERLVRELSGQRLVIVGPPLAPSRAASVPRVDALLASLAHEYGVGYVRTSGLELAYLADRLHLTPAAHASFGDFVAEQIART